MTNGGWVFVVLPLVVLVGAWGLIKLFTVFNSEDGERYRRMRMQGPFVPLSSEEIAEDERRRVGHS